MSGKEKLTLPKQEQDHQPGVETKMTPPPQSVNSSYTGSGKLAGKTAIITGGDSGIGKSVAIYFAKEGADVAICYLEEDKDAETTKELIEKEGQNMSPHSWGPWSRITLSRYCSAGNWSVRSN